MLSGCARPVRLPPHCLNRSEFLKNGYPEPTELR
jgi:hypothetical protein